MATRKPTNDEATEVVTEEEKTAAEENSKDKEIALLKEELAALKAVNRTPEKAPEGIQPQWEDEWNEYIDVVVPRHGRGQEKCFFVAVNGRNAQIPADGKLQHIRKPLAEALLQSLEAEAAAEQFAEELPHESAPADFASLMAVINDLKAKLKMSGISV